MVVKAFDVRALLSELELRMANRLWAERASGPGEVPLRRTLLSCISISLDSIFQEGVSSGERGGGERWLELVDQVEAGYGCWG